MRTARHGKRIYKCVRLLTDARGYGTRAHYTGTLYGHIIRAPYTGLFFSGHLIRGGDDFGTEHLRQILLPPKTVFGIRQNHSFCFWHTPKLFFFSILADAKTILSFVFGIRQNYSVGIHPPCRGSWDSSAQRHHEDGSTSSLRHVSHGQRTESSV